jgi:hypothetical protein
VVNGARIGASTLTKIALHRGGFPESIETNGLFPDPDDDVPRRSTPKTLRHR